MNYPDPRPIGQSPSFGTTLILPTPAVVAHNVYLFDWAPYGRKFDGLYLYVENHSDSDVFITLEASERGLIPDAEWWSARCSPGQQCNIRIKETVSQYWRGGAHSDDSTAVQGNSWPPSAIVWGLVGIWRRNWVDS